MEANNLKEITYNISGLSDQTLFGALTAFNEDMLLFITDLETGESVFSDNIKEFYDYPDDYMERSDELAVERIHPDDAKGYAEEIAAIMSGQKEHHFYQYRVANSKGEYSWIQCNGIVKKDENSGKRFFVGSVFRIDRMALYDSVTTLPSMDLFLKRAEHADRKANHDQLYRIVYFNIKNFKLINMASGLDVGNDLLRSLAEVLERCFPHAVISRFSADHFVVFTNSNRIEADIARAQEEFHRLPTANNMTLKAGIYVLPEEKTNIASACDLAKAAVDAIMDSEESIAYYDGRLAQKLMVNQYILSHVDEAIEKEWIKIWLQPVVRTITGKLCGVEALTRWIDPTYGFLSPASFIPVLEEAGQIYKLDQYAIRQACKNLKQYEEEGRPMVPVSVNLSRVDFVKCDIVNFIEQTTQEFEVPRDMLNIEITESIVMSDETTMKSAVDRFRNLGYQVWMDDFGSGYSSLNVLKDYQFDEIKLDMKFMSSFDDRSKEIVKAIVSMAKKIGIQTLAEGVETKEQFEFLRYIGCEKVQGYYFGKPAPAQELAQTEIAAPENLEPRLWKEYYNRMGASDFITDRPLSIVEYDGSRFTYLYVNDACQKVWDELGATLEGATRSINSPMSSFGKQIRNIREVCHVGTGNHEAYYTVRNHYVRMSARCLAEYQNKATFEIEVNNLTNSEAEEKRLEMEKTGSLAFTMFDTIFTYNFETEKVRILRQPAHKNKQPVTEDLGYEEAIQAASLFVHPRDREKYLQFFDLSTLRERITAKKQSFVTEYFRTLTANGAFVWKGHTILYSHDTHEAIYCSRVAFFDKDSDLVNRLSADVDVSTSDSSLSEVGKVIHHSMMESKTVNMYWKDINRRYVGVNQSFLDTFSFTSSEQVVGKTDEEMHWHINYTMLQEDEERILRDGVCVPNRLDKCIIDGATYDILSSREPVYENGEIVGLMGCFTVLENMVDEKEGIKTLLMRDPNTGLMSARGAMPVILDYVEGWENRRENFAVITINIPRYHVGVNSYGNELFSKLSARIGEVFRKVVSNSGNCASPYGGMYVVYTKCVDPGEIASMMQRIDTEIREIHSVDDLPVTLIPEMSVFYANEATDMQDLLWKSMLVAVFRNMDEYVRQYRNRDMLHQILDCLPCAVVVFSRSKEGKLTRLYISDYAKYYTEQDDPHEAEQTEIMSIVHPEDLERVTRVVTETVRAGKGMDEIYRIVGAKGKVSWLRHTAKAVPQEDGSCVFYAIYTDLTDQKNAEEKRKRDFAERYQSYLGRRLDANNMDNLLDVIDFQRLLMEQVADAFVSAHVVDLKTDSFFVIESKEYVRKLLEGKRSAREALECVVENAMQLESQEEGRAFLDLSTLTERVGDRKNIFFDFSGAFTGWCRAQFIPVDFDENGKLRTVIFTVQQVHTEKMKEETLRRLSQTDGLSKLYNHITGENMINKLLEEKRHGMFCLFDVDNFKRFNDSFGHAAGDEIIEKIGKCLKDTFREGDVLVRVGGDEFGVFIPDVTSRVTGDRLLQRMTSNLHDLKFDSFNGAITVSVGAVYSSEREFNKFDALYKVADTLMYSCKKDKQRQRVSIAELTREMPMAVLIYQADEKEKILFASKGLTELFDCENLDEFMRHTGGSFKNLVNAEELARVEAEIEEQIMSCSDKKIDYVEYSITSAKGVRKQIVDYGHLVDSEKYGKVYFVFLAEKCNSYVHK